MVELVFIIIIVIFHVTIRFYCIIDILYCYTETRVSFLYYALVY